MGFNPLSGISSILTGACVPGSEGEIVFQSPDGDFVYSDDSEAAVG